MSYMVSADLAATCSALGYFDLKANEYFAEENTLETVKDLIRYLRRDTEGHDARRQLGDTKVLQTDLIPLLKLYWKQSDLFDVLLRLMGNLTNPVLVLYNEEVPTDKTVRNQFLQILGHLQDYKEAFTDDDIWAVLCTRLSQLLNIECQERAEEDGLIIERILILVRNVLSVPADPEAEKRTDNDVSTHDKNEQQNDLKCEITKNTFSSTRKIKKMVKVGFPNLDKTLYECFLNERLNKNYINAETLQVIWALHNSGLLDIILYMTGSDKEEPYYMYLLEILSLILREQTPMDIANAAIARSEAEKIRDEAELLAIRHRETTNKSERIKKYTGARHSQFGGTYVVKNIKSISDENELIYHKPLNKVDVLNFDSDKSKMKIPKNRMPLQEGNASRRSTFSLRLFLKDFCVEFLNAGYNRLMENVRGRLVRAKSMSHDETYYLWAVRFFMEFNRHHKFDIKLVSETMAIHIFHFIQQRMENYFDMISSDKKKWPLWSKRLHVALQAYRELLLSLNEMDKSYDVTVRESARVIKSNVFYVVEYREFILTLLVTYNKLKMSQIYLLDLMETQHIFLKMLQAYCGKNNSTLVQKKRKAKKRKGKKQVPVVPRNESLDEKWDEVAPQLTIVLEGTANIPTDIVPFDASSDVPLDDQKIDAMVNIQKYLRENCFENAVGLLRSAREVWPENDSFGSNMMAPEEEFLALKEIFFADISGRDGATTAEHVPTHSDNEEVSEDEEDELAAGDEHFEMETDLKFEDFIKRFAHPKVIVACGLVLRNFDKNTVSANHSVLKLLHRIAWDCRMSAMIFQASIFRTFQRIFAERNVPQYKELVKFATYIVRQFIRVAQTNQKVFMELLFWKNSREAFDIEEGYGSYQTKSSAKKAVWALEEEDELRVLAAEYEQKKIEEEPVDWILHNLINGDRTRRIVIKKLKELMIMPKAISGSKRVPNEWQEHEIAQLTELFNQFYEDSDPLSQILERLTIKRPRKKITEKLLELRLIKDKREMRKKRESKSKGSRWEGSSSWNVNVLERELDSFSSDDSDEPSQSTTGTSTNIVQKKRINKPKTTTQRIPKKVNKKQKFNATVAGKLFVELVNKDMKESLEWIKENLIEAAEDVGTNVQVNDHEDIALVPISEKDKFAVNDPLFKKMLKAIGIREPADEQEIYWRISAKLTQNEINEIVDLITKALDNTLVIEETTENENIPPATLDDESSDDESSDDEEFFARFRNSLVRVRNSVANMIAINGNRINGVTSDEPLTSQELTILHNANESNEDEDTSLSSATNTDIESTSNEELISQEPTSFNKEINSKESKKTKIIVMEDSGSDEENSNIRHMDDNISEDISEVSENNLKRIRNSIARVRNSVANMIAINGNRINGVTSDEPLTSQELTILHNANESNEDEDTSLSSATNTDIESTSNEELISQEPTSFNKEINSKESKKTKIIVMEDSGSDEENSNIRHMDDNISEDISEVSENNLKRIRDTESDSDMEEDRNKKRKKRVISDSEED